MSEYDATSMQEAKSPSSEQPTSSSINPHVADEHHGQASLTVLSPHGDSDSQLKHVLVPTQSQIITDSYITSPYRAVGPSFSALSRLDYVPDERNEIYKTNDLSSDARANKPLYRPNDKSRGLRYFSTKVFEKVKEKGRTNYHQVADELIAEHFDSLLIPPQSVEKQQDIVENIRRRVYDALNVLMAMNIIEKEKKEIYWVGLPTSSVQECRRYEEEKLQRQERIRKKTEQLQELAIQHVAYKTLVQRNRENERLEERPPESKLLYLPLIVLNATHDTIVDCSIAPDKSEFVFNFDQPFEIHDDKEVLKRLGLSYAVEKDDGQPDYGKHVNNCLKEALKDHANQIIERTLASNVTSSPPAQMDQPSSTVETAPSPVDVMVPVTHPVLRANVPTNRRTLKVIRPRIPGGATHRMPIKWAASRPYTIPPSSVYRSTAQQPHSLPNGQIFSGHPYRQRTADVSIHRMPIRWIAPQPYTIPLSSVHRSTIPQHYSVPNDQTFSGQHVQGSIPRFQASYNSQMAELSTHDSGVMHYEENYGDEYEQQYEE